MITARSEKGSLNMVQFYLSPCDICGGQRVTDTGVSPSTSVFSLSISLHQFSIINFIYTLLLPAGQTGEAWEPTKKQCYFVNRGPLSY